MSDVVLSANTRAGAKQVASAETGKTLPPEVAVLRENTQESGVKASKEGVSKAVAELNAYVQNEQRDLLFSVDEGSGDMVVRVVDRRSGDLIRQIPNEVVLHLAAKARDNEPLQLISMQG